MVQSPEIAEYPDTGGFGVLAEMAQKSNETARMLMFVGREQQSLNYWEEMIDAYSEIRIFSWASNVYERESLGFVAGGSFRRDGA